MCKSTQIMAIILANPPPQKLWSKLLTIWYSCVQSNLITKSTYS